jgi:hypothetical protein
MPGLPRCRISFLSLYKLSLAQYHALLQQGILKDGDRIELLDGYLVSKMSKNRGLCFSPNGAAVNRQGVNPGRCELLLALPG